MATNGSYGRRQEIRSKRKWKTTTDLNSHFRSNQLENQCEDSTRKHITSYGCSNQGQWNGSLSALPGSSDFTQEKLLVSEDQSFLVLNSYQQIVESICHQDQLDGTITCLVCGEEGHYSCDCPMKDQEDKVICTLCSKRGHCRLWCCQQNKYENRACTRCGEIGHSASTHGLTCSSCDEYHQPGECRMRNVTCPFCECQDHYLAQCPLNSVLTTVCKDQRENFQAALRLALSKQGSTLSTPAKPSTRSPTPANPSTVSPSLANPSTGSQVCKPRSANKSAAKKPITAGKCYSCGDEGHYSNCCPSKPGFKIKKPKVLTPSKSNPIAKTGNATTRALKMICLKCHEEGHYANHCPQKPGDTSTNLSRELEASSTIPASPNLCKELEVQDPSTAKHSSEVKPTLKVKCFSCGEEGHRAKSCLLKHQVLNIDKRPLVTVDNLPTPVLICYTCREEGHYSYQCSQKRQKCQNIHTDSSR